MAIGAQFSLTGGQRKPDDKARKRQHDGTQNVSDGRANRAALVEQHRVEREGREGRVAAQDARWSGTAGGAAARRS